MKNQILTLFGCAILLSFTFLTYGQNGKRKLLVLSDLQASIPSVEQENETGKSRTAKPVALPVVKTAADTKALSESNVNLYGVSIYDGVNTPWGIVNFRTETPGTVNYIQDLKLIDADNNRSKSGEFANGYLYLHNGFYYSGLGWLSAYLLQISPVDWTVVNTIELSEIFGDMAFDVTTGVMFSLGTVQLSDESYVSKIQTVNLSSGAITEIVTLDRYFDVLACSASGQLYGVDENGYFCSINKVSGSISQIGSTGFIPYYDESMNFDPVSGRLFWALMNEEEEGKLIEIDITTGRGTDLGTIGDNSEIVALFSNVLPETIAPAVNSENVKSDASAYVSFNQNITAGTLATVTITPDPGNVSASVAGNRVTITHNNFAYHTEYTVTIPKSAITELSYDISWTFSTALDPAACNNPSALTVSDITTASASVGWTENGAGTSWDIKYGYAGFNPETGGTLISGVIANPYKITGLRDDTSYDVYVKAICAESKESNWGGPVNFITLPVCDPITVFPWTEGFEGEEFPHACWTMIDNDGDGIYWRNQLYTQSGEWVDIEGYNSSRAAGSASYSNDVGALTPDNWLITPSLQLPAGGYQLKYWVGAVDNDYYYDHYEVMVSTTGTNVTDFTRIYEETLATADWSERAISLSAYSGKTIYIAFVHNKSEDVYIMRIDNVEVSKGTTGLASISDHSSITLYPNPAGSYMSVDGFSGKESVEVYDITGSLVIRQGVHAGEKISVKELAQGLYWVKINGATLKMIKE